MPAVFHDQLTGKDLHDNKLYPATGTPLPSWVPLDARYAYKTFLSVGPAGSVGNDYTGNGTSDQAAIQAAIDAVAAVGGGVVQLRRGTYVTSAQINLASNVLLLGEGRGATILTTTMAGDNHNGIVVIANRDNILIRDLGFNVAGASTAITSYGHDMLAILDCAFTGTTTADEGLINLNGQYGLAAMRNTLVQGNRFYDIPNTNRVIHLYPRNGYAVEATKIINNHWDATFGHAIDLDAYAPLRGTIVAGNTFRDLVGGTNSALAGVALYGISSGGYQIADTLIVHNHYRNSRTSPGGEQYGFVYLYVAEQTVIANNVGVGSWTPTEPTIGPWLAPGRTDKENIGLIVTGNTIRGFDAPWDPDSMAEVEVAHNVVHACGTGFDLGYGTQRYVRIHDNIMVNSPHHSYGAAVLFANSTPVKCEVADNLYIDDRATPAMTKAIELTGNSDFCDVVVRGNRFYTPSGTITSPLFYHEQGNEVLPRVVEGNEVHDETGIRWFGAEQGASLATKTSAYTLITTDSVIVADATAGAFTVTLPSAAGIAGRQYTIKRTNGGGNNVTVGSMGGQTIDGASTKILGAQFSYLTVLSDGSAWQIVGQGGMVG